MACSFAQRGGSVLLLASPLEGGTHELSFRLCDPRDEPSATGQRRYTGGSRRSVLLAPASITYSHAQSLLSQAQEPSSSSTAVLTWQRGATHHGFMKQKDPQHKQVQDEGGSRLGQSPPAAQEEVAEQQQQLQRRACKQRQQQQHGCTQTADSPDLDPCELSCSSSSGNSSSSSKQPMLGFLHHLSKGKLLLAGAMSALVSRTAVAPLERVKMEQLLKSSSRTALETTLWVYQHEGLLGFWKGNALNVLRTAPFKALNFFSFDMYSSAFSKCLGEHNNSARFLAGACAGITATLVCFPLDVLRTRLMAPSGHKYGGPLATLRGIFKHEGVSALYAGCVPAVIGMAPAGAVFYGVYDLLKSTQLRAAAAAAEEAGQPAPTELAPLYTLLFGAAAGAAAEVIVYPLEVIRRKMQLLSMMNSSSAASGGALMRGLKAHGPAMAAAAGGAGSGAASLGQPWSPSGKILAACAAILRSNGLHGFYAGLLPNMLQVLPSASLSYFTYETTKHLLGVH